MRADCKLFGTALMQLVFANKYIKTLQTKIIKKEEKNSMPVPCFTEYSRLKIFNYVCKTMVVF